MRKLIYMISSCILIIVITTSCNNISNILKEKNNQLNNNIIIKIQSDITNLPKQQNNKVNYEKIKGVWISYLEYGWLMTEKSEEEFRNNIIKVFDNLKSKDINTAIIQVRSHSDSYYKSEYYPWSKYVTGVVAKEPTYDPLKIMIEEAHAKNISVHAWINPYRVMTDTQMEQIPDNYLIKQWYQNPNYMIKHNNYWYLNPSNEEVQNLIVSGVDEICTNYDIDGIQIDDYFYVAPPSKFNCDATTAQNSTTSLVKKIYDKIKSIDSNILFGVSPAGNYTDKPKSDTTQYTQLELWCTNDGYIDYVAPQVYWSADDDIAPFQTILDKWKNLCQNNKVDLVIGLAGYKFSKTTELQNQISNVNEDDKLNGYIIFRYDDIK